MSVIWWDLSLLGFPGQLPLADKLIYVRDKCGKCGLCCFFAAIGNHEMVELRYAMRQRTSFGAQSAARNSHFQIIGIYSKSKVHSI